MDLNVRAKTVKLIGINLYDLRFDNDFSEMTSKAWATEEKTDKSDFNKLKKLCTYKYTIKRMKRQRKKSLTIIYLIGV